MARKKVKIGTYVRESILEGESLHAVGTVHPVVLASPGIFLGFVFICVAWLVGALSMAPIFVGLCGAVVFLSSLPFIKTWIYLNTTEAAITSQRVLVKTGWISRQTDEISIAKVEAVLVNQGIFGRLVNVGDVTVKGTGGNVLKIYGIIKPMEFRTVLQQVAMAGH